MSAIDSLCPAVAGYDYALVSPDGGAGLGGGEPPARHGPEGGGLQVRTQAAPAGQTPTPEPRAVEAGGEGQPARDGREADEGRRRSHRRRAVRQGMQQLSAQERARLQRLQQRDRQVRAHERAHVAAGGRYVRGGARYQYQTGPDGRRYAVGGEVSIDASKEPTPEATIRKAQAVKRAALAPAQPSAQDRAVAAKAAQMEREARAELQRQRREEARAAARDQARDQGLTWGVDLPPAPPLAVRLRPLHRVV